MIELKRIRQVVIGLIILTICCLLYGVANWNAQFKTDTQRQVAHYLTIVAGFSVIIDILIFALISKYIKQRESVK